MEPIVIIGTGLAGYTVARELRKLDSGLPLTLVSADSGAFYAKPMLSNAFAQGKTAAQLVNTPGEEMAGQLKATLLARTRTQAIDPFAHRIETDAGALSYSRLVLALGADPIRLPLSGDAADAVLSVNDLDDYARFRDRLDGCRHIAIIGAGLIGSEFANDLAGAGYRVTVVDPSPYPLASLVPESAGRHVQWALGAAGVEWLFGTAVQRVDRLAEGFRLSLDNGSVLAADLVLSAVGLRPRIELARLAGLGVNRGIVVDRHLQTNAEDVFAIGDCAEIDGQVRPYVLPIMHAAKALAATLTGKPTAVEFPVMPVVVKTPACPVAVHPVGRDVAGSWTNEAVDGELRLRFSSVEGHLTGFALVGAKAVAERSSLVRQITR